MNRATSVPDLVVGHGGPLAQIVNAAMDVGVLRGVESGDRVDDHLRLLAGGGVVEVDERLSPDPAGGGWGSRTGCARRPAGRRGSGEAGASRRAFRSAQLLSRCPASPLPRSHRPQPFAHQPLQLVADRLQHDLGGDLGGKGVGQQPLRLCPRAHRGCGRRRVRRRPAGQPWPRGCISRRRRRSPAGAWCSPWRCRSAGDSGWSASHRSSAPPA